MASGAGELLKGRYQLLGSLGSGGGGSVHRALDLVLDREVAVRMLPAEAVVDPARRARLRAEARLTGSLRHRGIAQVFDVGETDRPAGSGEPTPYVVMELVDGVSLAEQLRAVGRLPADEAMRVLRQVAEALQVAHEAGVVHRDLKSASILLTPHGRSVLIGFAVAHAGEPGVPASPASDVQALGAVAYEALTGRPALGERPPFPRDVPAPVQDLVLEMLSAEPSDRPAGAQEVAIRATLLAAAAPVEATPAEQPMAPAEAAPESHQALRPSPAGLLRQWLGRRVSALPNTLS